MDFMGVNKWGSVLDYSGLRTVAEYSFLDGCHNEVTRSEYTYKIVTC